MIGLLKIKVWETGTTGYCIESQRQGRTLVEVMSGRGTALLHTTRFRRRGCGCDFSIRHVNVLVYPYDLSTTVISSNSSHVWRLRLNHWESKHELFPRLARASCPYLYIHDVFLSFAERSLNFERR